MNTLQQIITQFTMLVSLMTACGVLMHDTNIDKAFVSAFNAVDLHDVTHDDGGKTKVGSSPHTHPEHISLSSVVREGEAHPRTNPRPDERKYTVTKRRTHGGNNEFDGHRLCIAGICFG